MLARHPQQPQQVVVPLQRVDVEQHRARRVADVGDVRRAIREVPHEPAVDRAERQLAGLGPRARAGHVVEDPRDLGAGKVGVDDQARAFPDQVLMAVAFQAIADIRGPAVLPDDGVVDRLAGLAIPDHGGLALVRDADAGDVLLTKVRRAPAPPRRRRSASPRSRRRRVPPSRDAGRSVETLAVATATMDAS